MRGPCVDAFNPVAKPTPRRLKALGATGVRLVAGDDPAFYAYDSALAKAGLVRAHVYTGTTFDGAPDIVTRAATIAQNVRPGAINIVGNEWNCPGMTATWPAGGDEGFIAIWTWIAPVLPQPRYVGGMFSEPNILQHLARVWPRLDPVPDGVDFHPYLETSDEAASVLRGAQATFGCEVSCMEWNDSVPSDIGPFQALLDDLTWHSCFIPWSTEQLAGELPGIVKKNRVTAVGKAYRSALA